MSAGYSRLFHLARVLHEQQPGYALSSVRRTYRVEIRPEQGMVLDAMAAEAGVKPSHAVQLLMDAALSSDRVLVRWVFLGEVPEDEEERLRIEAEVAKDIALEEEREAWRAERRARMRSAIPPLK